VLLKNDINLGVAQAAEKHFFHSGERFSGMFESPRKLSC